MGNDLSAASQFLANSGKSCDSCCPVLYKSHFIEYMGHGMGQAVDPYRDPYYLKQIYEKSSENQRFSELLWLRGKDLNQRPPGYEPDELPAALPRDIY